MAEKKKQKKRKKQANPLLVLALVVLISAVGVKVAQVYGKLAEARGEKAVLVQQVSAKEKENAALRSDLARADDTSFIMSLARELLGLVGEGERIFIDVND